MNKEFEQTDTQEPVTAAPYEQAVEPAGALAQCEQQLAEWQEKYIRANADFDNFRKRTAKDQALWRQQAQAEILGQLLEIVDNFDRALEKEAIPETQAWREGFVLIRKSFDKLLHAYGVERMNNYGTFDPQYHEALMHIDSPNHTSGDIVAIIQHGYLMHGTILRPAQVVVAK
jgi:molecular chaperone GrpE